MTKYRVSDRPQARLYPLAVGSVIEVMDSAPDIYGEVYITDFTRVALSALDPIEEPEVEYQWGVRYDNEDVWSYTKENALSRAAEFDVPVLRRSVSYGPVEAVPTTPELRRSEQVKDGVRN